MSSRVIDLTDDLHDDLSSMRGLVASMLLSLPVWVGVGYVAWRHRH